MKSSLGTSNEAHRPALEAAVRRAAAHGAVVVAASEDAGVDGTRSLETVAGVKAEWQLDRTTYALAGGTGRIIIATSPYPRRPGVPRDRNLPGSALPLRMQPGSSPGPSKRSAAHRDCSCLRFSRCWSEDYLLGWSNTVGVCARDS